MRLLTLVDLGMTETGRIPYFMIKDTLKINDIKVESWVVKPMYKVCIWDKSVAIASSKAYDLDSKSHSS
ncbi:hypothetical protein R3W88_004945 [Solanum pinnatisectum]|uniref:Uncharacterized protein n=1 Tax=Solanum pinnatisectum TaxID=50273 RepID=A0AAV9KB65_9SOLN|nr:hypothetical protein R3W88_004945 [Solanum pinnatisectum]